MMLKPIQTLKATSSYLPVLMWPHCALLCCAHISVHDSCAAVKPSHRRVSCSCFQTSASSSFSHLRSLNIPCSCSTAGCPLLPSTAASACKQSGALTSARWVHGTQQTARC
jgi:hypothetical protein